MQEQLATAFVGKHRLLSGLAERFGGLAVQAACKEVHGIPVEMVTTTAEATAILNHLKAKE